ncbi:flagellar motor switch protein FliN [Hansschlegelia sp. KR7-227]|jgi:flagellar motor switch protein FliN/FliY|uniref:flagellar motor switch protein FliN n=1 Tax=Hansschlegelia sp. KR7-227 TaxID=3400914 RepID=UPI003C10772C
MSADKTRGGSMPLPELDAEADLALVEHGRPAPADGEPRVASDLEAVFDVPVAVSAVLGRASVEVQQLMRLKPGAIIELDRKVGEAIDIYVNDRLVARGEVVLVEDKLGVTMTEIIKPDRA